MILRCLLTSCGWIALGRKTQTFKCRYSYKKFPFAHSLLVGEECHDGLAVL